jgi:hypothetical protein
MGMRTVAITIYPNKYPKAIIIYENWVVPTNPGTDINVTPESEVPIIPKATTYHGDFLLAMKKVCDVAFREVRCAIIISTIK